MAPTKRNGRALSREDLRDAIDANTRLTKTEFGALKESFESYKNDHDRWGADRIKDIDRRIDAFNDRVDGLHEDIKGLRDLIQKESSSRKTVAAIAAGVGSLLGALIGWLLALATK